MRLNRFLSLCGLGSRRGCEELILQGHVAINGRRVTDLATQVETGATVAVDGRRVEAKQPVTIALNKPKGYLCTREDTHGRSTIYDLLPDEYHTLHHVGRLDQDSEGLLLLTNQGDLSQQLLHPSQGVDKEYEVRVEEKFDPSLLIKLTRGVTTKEGFARAERAWLENPWLVHVVLKQGLKRQIREMFYVLGHEVERLVRIRIGGLWLKGLAKGSWRQLTEAEIARHLKPRKTAARTLRRPAAKRTSKNAAPDDDDIIAPPPLKPKSAGKASPPAPRSKPASPAAGRDRARGFDHEGPAPAEQHPAGKTRPGSRARHTQKLRQRRGK